MLAKTHLALTVLAVALATVLLIEWRSERHDRAQLQATLQAAEQSLQRASANQHERDNQLNDTLAKMESLKATVRTQQQILDRFPEVLPLPAPLQMPTMDTQSVSAQESDAERKPAAPLAKPPTPGAVVPSEDLKPLFDFAVDCKACQTRLATATADLADEKTKTQSLSRERDAALKLARGGSLRQRMGRALKWFVVGAIAGAVAAKAH